MREFRFLQYQQIALQTSITSQPNRFNNLMSLSRDADGGDSICILSHVIAGLKESFTPSREEAVLTQRIKEFQLVGRL